MTFQPNQGLSQDEITERVDSTIEDNEVVLFMKGNRLMPQCGFSQRALELITQYREDVECVDTLESLDEYRAALAEHSGWETTPQTYVNGEFMGGSDTLAEMDERADLESALSTE